MRITVEIPDDLAAALAATGQELSRTALEAIGIEGLPAKATGWVSAAEAARYRFAVRIGRIFEGAPSRNVHGTSF